MAESAGGENPVAVDVVVPLFRPGKWLERCLASLVSSQGARLYPILVDDCPEDPRAAAAAAGIPGALGLTTERNLGFAAAVNRGIAAGSSQYVLCLNQDTELRGDFIARLARRLADDDGLGSAGGKLLHRANPQAAPDGLIDSAGIHLRWGWWPVDIGQGDPDDGRYNGWREVFGVTGAAVLFRRSALDVVTAGVARPFDERFVMYKEDVDLAWRLRLAGYRAAIDGRAIAYHARGVGRPSSNARGKPRRSISTSIRRAWQQERGKPNRIRQLSWRNQLLLLVKNERGSDLIRHIPSLLAVQLVQTSIGLAFDPMGTLRSRIALARDLPWAISARSRPESSTRSEDRVPLTEA